MFDLHLLAKCSAAVAEQSSISLRSSTNNSKKDSPTVIAEHAERFLVNVMDYADGHSYAAVLQAWSYHDPFRAAQLLNDMIDQYGIVNQVCYNICIRALANAGRAPEAEELLWSMNDRFLATGHPEALTSASKLPPPNTNNA